MYILSFFTTKISAHCLSFMIFIEELFFTHCEILSIKGISMKFMFRGKSCVQMNQRVTRHLTFGLEKNQSTPARKFLF